MSGGGADATSAHLPVMFAEVMDGLAVKQDGSYLDGTFGRGGHAGGILQRLGAKGRLLVMDKDPEAIAVATRMADADARLQWHRGSFAGLADWAATSEGLDGVLLDLGVSSPQLDASERGFSFTRSGPIDMRMDPTQGPTALDLIRALPPEALVNDIVYAPLETDLLRRAKARGNTVVDGLGMLLHQARAGFKAWFGVDPQVDAALRQAVLAS